MKHVATRGFMYTRTLCMLTMQSCLERTHLVLVHRPSSISSTAGFIPQFDLWHCKFTANELYAPRSSYTVYTISFATDFDGPRGDLVLSDVTGTLPCAWATIARLAAAPPAHTIDWSRSAGAAGVHTACWPSATIAHVAHPIRVYSKHAFASSFDCTHAITCT